MPSCVLSIGEYAFTPITYDNGLESITFGGGSRLCSIGRSAFGSPNDSDWGLVRLTTPTFPGNLTYFGMNLFRRSRSNFTNFIIPSKVTYITHAMFYQDGNPYWSFTRMYFPISITDLHGPRRGNGSTDNGMDSYCFPKTSNSSVAVMPSHMQSLFNGTDNRFNYYSQGTPTGEITPSYYSIETLPANSGTSRTSIVLSSTVANVTNYTTTTQRHIEIAQGVTIVGNGSANFISGSKLNLISINIPNSVTSIAL